MKVQTIIVWHLAVLVTAEWQLEQFKVADLKMEEHLKCLKHEEDKDIKQFGDKCIFIFFYIQPSTVTRFQQVSGHLPVLLYCGYLHDSRLRCKADIVEDFSFKNKISNIIYIDWQQESKLL